MSDKPNLKVVHINEPKLKISAKHHPRCAAITLTERPCRAKIDFFVELEERGDDGDIIHCYLCLSHARYLDRHGDLSIQDIDIDLTDHERGSLSDEHNHRWRTNE